MKNFMDNISKSRVFKEKLLRNLSTSYIRMNVLFGIKFLKIINSLNLEVDIRWSEITYNIILYPNASLIQCTFHATN